MNRYRIVFRVGAVAALTAAAIHFGHSAVHESPAFTRPAQQAARKEPHLAAESASHVAKSATAVHHDPPQALPPAGAPLAQSFADLLARSEAGDASAAS